MQAITQADIKQALIEATKDACDVCVFGAPTMIVGEDLHFGQDRLEWVERALRSNRNVIRRRSSR